MSEDRQLKTEQVRREVVARWMSSGLSQAEFCRKEGLRQSALSDWKKLERKPASGSLPVEAQNRYSISTHRQPVDGGA